MPKTMQKSPTADSTTPIQSNRCAWVSRVGTSRQASTIASRPTGTLMKKIHSHPRVSTSTPPRTGPTSVATPATAPHRPMACPRDCGGKRRVITDIVCGLMSAAPRPWTTRATMSPVMVPVSPHHRDARVKIVSPTR